MSPAGLTTAEWRDLRAACDRERALRRITPADLAELARLAEQDEREFFARHPEYRAPLIGRALCQGAALHYTGRGNGVKDWDVWSFYAGIPSLSDTPAVGRPYPARRHGRALYDGRPVDLYGRTLQSRATRPPVTAIRAYLKTGQTESARRLAVKAAVLIWPPSRAGEVIWPVS